MMSSIVLLLISLLTVGLTVWNIRRFSSAGGMSKLLKTVYSFCFLLQAALMYAIMQVNWAREYNMFISKVIIYFRILFGLSYIWSMIEMDHVIRYHLFDENKCLTLLRSKRLAITYWTLNIATVLFMIFDIFFNIYQPIY